MLPSPIFCSIKMVPDPVLSGAIARFLRPLCAAALSQPRDSSVSASHCFRDIGARSRSVALLSREQLCEHCRSATASITSRLQPSKVGASSSGVTCSRRLQFPKITVLGRSVGLWIANGQLRQLVFRSGMHSPQSGQNDKKLGAL